MMVVVVVMLKRAFYALPIVGAYFNRCNLCYCKYSGNTKISYQSPSPSLLYVFLSLPCIKAESSRTSSLENQHAETCLDLVAHSLICSSLN